MSQYYYYDGQNPVGPHTAVEIGQLLWDQFITTETLIFVQGAKDWKPASAFPELLEVPDPDLAVKPPTIEVEGETGEAPQGVTEASAPPPTATAQVQEEEPGDEDPVDKGLSKYQILRLVRTELDRLWECQRESIISSIKNEELSAEYVKTRRQSREIKVNIQNLALDYFRKSNVLKTWIHDLTWTSTRFKTGRADVRKKLQGATCQERYENAIEWLEKMGLTEVEGCYCFQNEDGSYRYIGKAQAQTLGQRLKQWEKASFWLESTHLRIVIPKFKSQSTKLERLLIMLYQPMQNEKPGGKGGNNPADKVLEMIQAEIQDLLVDG